MKAIRSRSLVWRFFDGCRPERWAFTLVTVGAMASSACWLNRDIVEPPPPAQDGAVAPPSDGGAAGCKWVGTSAGSCTLTDVSCHQRDACPPSWMEANSPGSCPEAGATLLTETCDGMYRWSLASSDGSLVVACYYDMSNGLLAGIDAQTKLPCGSAPNRYGTVPQSCHYDAGVEVQRITCAAAGSGDLTDGGFSVSCSEAMPCHGGG